MLGVDFTFKPRMFMATSNCVAIVDLEQMARALSVGGCGPKASNDILGACSQITSLYLVYGFIKCD